MNLCFLLHVCIQLIYLLLTDALLPQFDNFEKIPRKSKLVPPCSACRSLVTSFLKALEETSRSNFEGGDADWEREKLGTYENSELRLIEIQEILCAEISGGKDQCYNLAELYEDQLEEWFYNKRHKGIDLLEFLCISHLKICCPENTFGPECEPCPGGVKTPCGGRGKCKNEGTREKPGNCLCNVGYTGELCSECENGYYKELEPTFTCKLCDRACKSHCRGPGPKNCEVCSAGYHFVPNEGCIVHFDDDLSSEKISDDLSNETEGGEVDSEVSLEGIGIESTEHSEL